MSFKKLLFLISSTLLSIGLFFAGLFLILYGLFFLLGGPDPDHIFQLTEEGIGFGPLVLGIGSWYLIYVISSKYKQSK